VKLVCNGLVCGFGLVPEAGVGVGLGDGLGDGDGDGVGVGVVWGVHMA